MKKPVANIFFSMLFLSIFLCKMVISVAPLVIAHLDKKSVNDVIMQLEIEHPKSADAKDAGKKDFLNLNAIKIAPLSPVLVLMRYLKLSDHDKHIPAFYPSVPTPPPNA